MLGSMKRGRARAKVAGVRRYELYYWPTIQGRGEFIRLALEEGGAPYVDVARRSGGVKKMVRMLRDGGLALPPFAPPFLKDGDFVVAQTSNILSYLAPHLGLGTDDEKNAARARQIQLTIADLVTEAHETHHPIAASLYYEDQKAAARKRSEVFASERIPKYLAWLERLLVRSDGDFLLGRRLSYVDLSAFQVVSGLSYAFPNTMARLETTIPELIALRDRVAVRPRIAAYLSSSRRLAFNEQGIFRHYPELDRPKRRRAPTT